MKKVYLGINISHGASASLMIDGEVVLAYQEERFNKIKNFIGYPKKSIESCLNFVREKKIYIDNAAFSTIKNPIFVFKYPLDNYFSIEDWLDYYLDDFYSKSKKIDKVRTKIKTIKKKKIIDHYLDYSQIKKKDYFANFKIFRNLQKKFLEKQSQGLIKKISFLGHHACHAHYAAYAPTIKSKKNEKVGILTLDSEGDGINQTFWIFDRLKNDLKKINESSECDLARIYRFITLILKMKPTQHEYKVMGLAPYSKNEYAKEVYDKVFKNILMVKNCRVINKKRPKDLFTYLYKTTRQYRFDNIAGAAQMLIENIIVELIKQISKKYKINNFSISGGVSMNIKMNMCLSKLKYVNKIYIPPTGTDESLSIGACYYLNKRNNSKFLSNIYLGQKLFDGDLKKNKIIKFFKNKKKFKIFENVNHKQIAKLLTRGSIIAVARGREEFGARALGNRSILANTYSEGIIQRINDQIKNRDFWMPFALTILHDHHKKYLKNEKNIISDFMTIGYDTVKSNYMKIKNGTHQYDKTVRPQILRKEFNKDYYSLLSAYFKISKIPALLNTSLNIHGYPISSRLEDVIFTFKNSGLQYLYLEDNFLIKKNEMD